MKRIDMTPETDKIIGQLLPPNRVDGYIVHLENAEQALQEVAYEDRTGIHDYLFRFAHELKIMRKELEQLEQLLGYHPDRE